MAQVVRRVAALTSLGLCVAGCDRPPTGPAPASGHDVRAITVADWTPSGYASAAGRAALEDIASAGANTAVFVLTFYQDTRVSSDPENLPGHTADPAAVRAAVRHAADLGLDAVLKLHVDVLDGTWRGLIDPRDPEAWFAAYGRSATVWAETSQEFGLPAFVLGTELATTMRHEVKWRALIEECREVYYGEILYAASWDEADVVPFWDALDAVGVDFYFPVATRSNPSRIELLAEWQPKLDALERLCRRAGRDVWITEIGYPSRDGAGMYPADYTRLAPVDLDEQADLYWAALTATANETWVRGLCWWSWDVDRPGGPGDDGYTPRGKPALDVLRNAWTVSGP